MSEGNEHTPKAARQLSFLRHAANAQRASMPSTNASRPSRISNGLLPHNKVNGLENNEEDGQGGWTRSQKAENAPTMKTCRPDIANKKRLVLPIED